MKARCLCQLATMSHTTYDYIMVAQEIDEPEELKTAYNNPKEAEQFMSRVMQSTDRFMSDILSYDRYKQEEAYGKFVRKYMKELQKLDDYFNEADPQLILDIIDDKMCELIRKPEPDPHTIKSHRSEQKLLTGHGSLQELAHKQSTPVLSDEGQATMVQIFTNLQFTCEYSAKVAKAVAQFRTVAKPEQFGFIMRRAVRPLIQLQIPPQLASPANWNFRKERLTKEQTLEEQGVNQMLPWPFHPKLVAIDEKHLTRCIAVAVHWLIRKVAFETKISQNKVAEKFHKVH